MHPTLKGPPQEKYCYSKHPTVANDNVSHKMHKSSVAVRYACASRGPSVVIMTNFGTLKFMFRMPFGPSKNHLLLGGLEHSPCIFDLALQASPNGPPQVYMPRGPESPKCNSVLCHKCTSSHHCVYWARPDLHRGQRVHGPGP